MDEPKATFKNAEDWASRLMAEATKAKQMGFLLQTAVDPAEMVVTVRMLPQTDKALEATRLAAMQDGAPGANQIHSASAYSQVEDVPEIIYENCVAVLETARQVLA
jgi:hypothetical protein